MREMLFRGKGVETGRWVYGYYYSQLMKDENQKYYRVHEIIPEDGLTEPSDVYPETVGQYIEHYDINGQKIFQHDIVKLTALGNDHNQRGATVISQIAYYQGTPVLTLTYVPICNFYYDHTIEVIGNVFDNPELVEVV